MEIVDEKKRQENIDKWMQDNYLMLTEWLTNIVAIREVDAKQTPSLFQTFVVPIRSEPPWGLVVANNEMKYMLMLSTVFGLAQVPEPTRPDVPLSSAQIGDYKLPANFSGFKQQVGRLPIEGDIVLYSAVKWFEVSFKRNPLLLGGEGKGIGHSILETVCTIDCLPRDIPQG